MDLIDLTHLCRTTNNRSTRVVLAPPYRGAREEWLKLGMADLIQHQDYWILKAYLKNAKDFEHDGAFALRLPLIGVTFEAIYANQTHMYGWVRPDDHEDFNVPTSSSYNPFLNATVCDQCEEKHYVVPEGFYVPPFDRGLYETVKGRKVQLIFS